MSRSLAAALGLVAVVFVLLGIIQLTIARPETPFFANLLSVIVVWVYVAAGILAWWRRPDNRMGLLITIGGLALYLGTLDSTNAPLLNAVSLIFGTAVLAVTVHLLHAYPSGRLRGSRSKAVVLAGYIVAIGLQAPLYLFSDAPEWAGLSVGAHPDLFLVSLWVQRIGGALVMVTTAVLLWHRIRRAEPAHRRRVGLLYGYGIAAVLGISLSGMLLTPENGISPEVRFVIQLLLVAGIPITFSLAVIRGGFTRTGVLEDLAAQLGSIGADRQALSVALAQALGDPSVRVVYRASGRDGHTDEDGNAVPPPVPTATSAVSVIKLDGRTVGAIAYDSRIVGDSEFVDQAGRVAAIAMDRQRLTAALRLREQELRKSRLRLLEESDRERKRIARDLHDGLQAELVLLALHAQELSAMAIHPTVRTALPRLRERIDDAAGELRRLVHDIMPATLDGRGLAAAIEDLADRMPLPTHLEMAGDSDLPLTIERTAYFVVAEGLANVVKHSQARSCTVRVERSDHTLVVEVEDDGLGEAAFGTGTGLRGIDDRVDAIGGRLHVVSSPGIGTRIRAELPCES